VRQRWWAELQAGGHQAELLRLAAAAGLHLAPVGAAIAAEPLLIELGVGGHQVELLAWPSCCARPSCRPAGTRASCCAWSSRR